MEDKKQQTEETLRSIFGGSVDTIDSNEDKSKSIQLNAPDTTPIIAESPVVAGGDNLNINVNVTQNLIQREVERAVNSILETTSNPADIKKNYTDEYQAGNSSVTQSNFFESSPPPSSVLSGIPINNSFVNNFTNNAVTNPVYDTRTTVSRSSSPINTTQANTSIAGSPPSTLNMSFNSNLSSRQMEIMQQYPDLFKFESDHPEINQIHNNQVGSLVAGVASNNYNNRTTQSDAIKRHLDIYTESSNSKYGYNASRENFGSLIRKDTTVENDQITKDRTQSVTATIIETEKAKAIAEFYGYPEFFDKERPVQQYPKTTDSPYMMFYNRSEINNDQLTKSGIDYSRSWTGLKELPEKLKFDTKFATNLADRETLQNVRIDPVYNTDKSGNIIKPTWYSDSETTENTVINNNESSNNTQMLSPGDSVNAVGVENNYNVMQSPMQSPLSVNVDENITDNTTTVNTAPQEGEFFIENAPGNLSSFEARSRLTDDSNPNYLKFDVPEQADDAALKLESANRLMEQTKHLNLTDRQREIMQERPELFDRYMYYNPPGPDNWVDRGNGFRENLTLPDQSPNLPSPEKIQKTIESGDRAALKVLLDNHFGQFGTSDNNPVWRKYGDFNGGDVTSASGSADRASEGNNSENKSRVNLNKATESQSAYITPTEDARLLAEFYGLDYYFNFAGDSDYLLATKSTGTQRNATKDKNEDGTVEKNTSSKLNRLPTANITPISSLPTYLTANVPEKTQSQTYNPGSYDAVEKIRSGRGFGANDSNRPISSDDIPEDVIGDANTNVSFKPVYIQNDNGSTVLIPRESDRTRVPVSPEPPQPSPPQSPIDLQGVESNYNTSQLNQNNQEITDISTTMASPLAMPSPESPTTVNNIDNSVVDNSVSVSNTNISSNILPGTPASMIAQLTMATTSTTNVTDDKTVAISPPAEGEFFIENAPGHLSSAPGHLSSFEARSRLTDDSNPNYLKFDVPEQADDAASRLEAGNKLLEQYKDVNLTDRQKEILQQYPHLFANTDYIPQPDEIADEIARGDTEYLSQMLGDHLESYGTSNNNPIWKKYRDFGAGRAIVGGAKERITDSGESTFEVRKESTSPFVVQTEEANALAEFYELPQRFSSDPTNPDANLPYMMVQAVRGSIDSQTTTASNEIKTNENYTSNPTANITQLAELPSLINSTSRSPIIPEPGSYDDVESIRAGANYGANNPIRRPDMSKVGDGNPDVGYNPVYIRNPDGTIRRQEYDTPSPEPSPPQAPIDLQGVESNYTQMLSPGDSVNAVGVENNYNVMQSPMSVSTDQNITNNNTSETNLNIIAGSPAAMISQLAFATIQNESSYVNPNSPEGRINNTSVTNTSSYVNPNSPEGRINNTSVTNTSSYVNRNSPEGRINNTSVTNTSSYVNPNSPEGRINNTSVTNTSVTNTSSYVNPNSPEGRINNTSESSTPQEPIDLQGVEENYSVLQTNTNDTTNEVNSNVDSMSYLNNSIIDNSNVSNVFNDGLVSNVSNVLGDTNVSTINRTTSNTQQSNTNVNHNINNNQISSNEVNNMLLSQYSNMNYITSTYNQSTNKTSSDSYSPIRHSDNTNLHTNINSNKTTFESVSYNPSSINENITKILNTSIQDNYSSAISTISKSSNNDFTYNIKNIVYQMIMENEAQKQKEKQEDQMTMPGVDEIMQGESEIEPQELREVDPADTTNINEHMIFADPDLSMFIENINSPPVWRTVLS